MGRSQCPVCYTPLEVRAVTPCYICGGWPESVERFLPDAKFMEWRLPASQAITLCAACELEDFMVPNGWGHRLGLRNYSTPIAELRPVRLLDDPQLERDKFCPTCNLRLAFLEIVAQCG